MNSPENKWIPPRWLFLQQQNSAPLPAPKQLSGAAKRMRRYRARKRAIQMSIRLNIDAVSVPEALIAAGLLHPRDYDNPRAVAAALECALINIEGVTPA